MNTVKIAKRTNFKSFLMVQSGIKILKEVFPYPFNYGICWKLHMKDPDAYSEPRQTSKAQHFAKIGKAFGPLTILKKLYLRHLAATNTSLITVCKSLISFLLNEFRDTIFSCE